MSKAAILRTPYPYGRKQTWLSVDVHNVAARLEASGIETDVFDLNLQKMPDIAEYDHVAIGVMAPPFVPDSIKLAEHVRLAGKKPILGGQVIEKLRDDEFRRVYGNAIQVKNNIDMAKAFGLERVPPMYDAGISESLGKIEPVLMKNYLESEMSFFTSQGCEYGCEFCCAPIRMPETFSKRIEDDLKALAKAAHGFDIKKLSMYISALDAFQNPEQFKSVLEIFAAARRAYGIEFNLRCLSRIDSFLGAMHDNELSYLMRNAGLGKIGFGVDGVTERVWKEQHKGNKSLSEADTAFDLCKANGIVPEALLVMGYNAWGTKKGDTPDSLKKTYKYAMQSAERGVCVRPHVAKEASPGNNGWEHLYWKNKKEKLFQYPNLWKNLDFTMEASELTHPDIALRAYVNEAFWNIVRSLPEDKCTTKPLRPYRDGTGTLDKEWNAGADFYNSSVPCDR